MILLSTDSQEEDFLRDHLEIDDIGRYQLEHYKTLKQLREIELEAECDAVLLDLRDGYNEARDAIKWIGGLASPIAIICLCKDHEQLKRYKSVTHLIDDYILASDVPHGELSTRIGHAIRRRRKEYELKQEQNLFRSLLENIPDAVYFKDLRSRFIKVNEAMASNYGYDQESILGKSDADLFTEEHAQPAYEDEQNIIRTGEPIVGKQEKETFDDGTIKWVSTTKLPLRDEHDHIIGTMGISRNITDLKIAEQKLASESTLLKTIIDHALAGIFVKDRQGKYLLVNQRHANYLGEKDADAVKGKSIQDYFDPQMAKTIAEEDEKIMHTATGIESKVHKRKRPGIPPLWLLTSKVPLMSPEGACVGLVGISIDITKQIKNEEKLKDTIHTLEETKLQLIEAEKLKTVGRLAAGVAHEVKNPLNVVSLGAEYLSAKISEPKELVDIIGDMQRAIEKANQVIFELLDYSSPHTPSMGPIDLNSLIRQVLSMLRHNFNEAHVKVSKELEQSLPLVTADPPKLEQVFMNVFLNAIAAIEKGGSIHIRTYAHRMKNTGGNVSSQMSERFRIGDPIVTVEVSDTGHGIKEEDANKVFDPFYSTKASGKGTGLGLSVTRSIIEMHRGVITLKNRSDSPGTCATIHLPATPHNDDQVK